jgi:hypothetical protein
MAGTMSEADLVADLKASLHDAASVFTEAADAAFKRHLSHAAADFSRRRPRTLLGSLTVTAGELEYDAVPGDLVQVKCPIWGRQERATMRPWESGYPGPVPKLRLVENEGERRFHVDPPPTAAQVSVFGATLKYYYFAAHSIGADAADTTIAAADRALLLLRAQAEAMKEAAARNMAKPAQLRDSISGVPRNGHPAALYEQLMQEFDKQVRLAA